MLIQYTYFPRLRSYGEETQKLEIRENQLNYMGKCFQNIFVVKSHNINSKIIY